MKDQLVTSIIFLLLLTACSSSSKSTEPLIHTPASLATIVSTLTEGELAAAAAGTAKYSHYFPTVEECKRAVDNKEVNNCVAPDSIKQITRPEWTQLFPNTDFYVIGLLGRDEVEVYDNSYRRDLVAWQNGQYYNATTFGRLLSINHIVVTDSNRELVAKAFALTTLGEYLEQDVAFTNLTKGDWDAGFKRRFTYMITAWTKIQGLKMYWLFAFQGEKLWLAESSFNDYHVDSYIDVPFETLPLPGVEKYYFQGQ